MLPKHGIYLLADAQADPFGPYSLAEARARLTDGQLDPAAALWSQADAPAWRPAFELLVGAATSAAIPALAPVSRAEPDHSVRNILSLLVLVVFLFVMFGRGLLPGVSLGAAAPATFTIRVEGTPGVRFHGSYGSEAGQTTVESTVPADYTVSGQICSCSFQKQEREGTLEVALLVHSQRIAEQQTTAAYGVVTTSARVKP